jgi:hypothetical protein
MSIVLVGATSGSVTLQEPAVAGNTVLDLPATSGTLLTTGTAVTPAQGGTGLTSPGTAGNVLTSNGTSWVSSTPSVPSAGTGPAFGAYQSSQQNIASLNTWIKVNLQTEYFDTNNNFASSRFTPTVAGYYQVNACMNVNYWNGIILSCGIWKNGSPYRNGNTGYPQTTGGVRVTVSDLVYLNGTTDYIELYGFNYAATSNNVVTASQYGTYFTAFLARSA